MFFLEGLKSLPNTFNMLLLSGLLSMALYKRGSRTLGKVGIGLTLFLFLLVATPFFPRFVIARLEQSFKSPDLKYLEAKKNTILVHVLGAGYSLDPDLSANSQLDLITLGRLAEALRICNEVSQTILVCSGGASVGPESQASVVRRAAISLGLHARRIRILPTPKTTAEEARALADAFGRDVTLVLVTDALHMSRAVRLFKAEGFQPIPAPTNYLVKGHTTNSFLKWMPSVKNILLTDRLLHEFLGNMKACFL